MRRLSCSQRAHCRFKANTYLNELSLTDYREALGRHFEIVKEENHDSELGRRFLTPEGKADLAMYSEEELLLNTVRFVCRARSQAGRR